MKKFDYKFLIYSVISGILALGFYYLTKIISFGYVAFWMAAGAAISNLLLAFKIKHFEVYNNFSFKKFGLFTLPANNNFLQLLFFKIDIIFPN